MMNPPADTQRWLYAGVLFLYAQVICAEGFAVAPGAAESGVMQGRPVPQEHKVTLANWMHPPFNRWSLQHVPQILPTATVSRGSGRFLELSAVNSDLGAVEFSPEEGKSLRLSQWLAASYTDGFIVVQDGKIVLETYLNGMTPQTRHLTYSISKSVIGIAAGILVDSGELDTDLNVEDYIPELRDSGLAGYKVRELLDMLAAIDWDENYADPNSTWRRWKDAIGWTPAPDNATDTPLGNYNFLPTLKRDADWPGGFKYVSPTAEAAGWVLEKASGMPLAEVLSKKLWSPLGAEQDAYITTDRSFAAAAAGGFGATLRDMARFGQMVLNGGSFNSQHIVSREWIDDIRFNGDNAAWRNGQYRGYWNPQGAYRSFWYVSGDTDGSLDAIGIHGQRLYINPAKKLVVVRLSSLPNAVNRNDYELSSKAINAIIGALK